MTASDATPAINMHVSVERGIYLISAPPAARLQSDLFENVALKASTLPR
jgi:hypothetical protein